MKLASVNSDNADGVDPGDLPSGTRSFLGGAHTEVVRSRRIRIWHIITRTSRFRSLFRATTSTKEKLQTLVATQANKSTQIGCSFTETMAISRYRTMICWSVEEITSRLLVKIKMFFTVRVGVAGMRTTWTMSLLQDLRSHSGTRVHILPFEMCSPACDFRSAV